VAEALREGYGVPKRRRRDPLDALIQTVLSQKTTSEACRNAFETLKGGVGDWDAVLSLGVEEVVERIRSAGLAAQKAPRILAILECLQESRGRPALDHISSMNIRQAEEALLALPGVGPKTAKCVLLFALGRDVLPVDTHVGRLARRVGLVSARLPDARIHDVLESLVRPEDRYSFHVNGFEHGRRVCLARRPRCALCVLRRMCDRRPEFEREP
jgi:endonuclease-3